MHKYNKMNFIKKSSFLVTLLITVLCSFFFNSCKKAEEVLYFQGEFIDSTSELHSSYFPVIQKNDMLEVMLTTANEEATKLFTPAIQNNKTTVTYSSGVASKNGFLVDQNGFIELPFIGKILAHGKKRNDLEDEIESKLSEYIKEPIVLIQIINFKVTVLGDVRRPGTISVPNEKISLIEAIAIAGDLNITAERKKVVLIREVNGVRKEFIIDLTSKDFFSSQFYFLQQNDVIYVSPNRAKINSSSYSQIYLPILSSISLILTAINLIIK